MPLWLAWLFGELLGSQFGMSINSWPGISGCVPEVVRVRPLPSGGWGSGGGVGASRVRSGPPAMIVGALSRAGALRPNQPLHNLLQISNQGSFLPKSEIFYTPNNVKNLGQR